MKKIMLLILILMQIQCFAQTRLAPGEIRGTHSTFIINKLELFDSIKYIDVYSKNNKYNDGIPRSNAEKDPRFLPMNPVTDIHVDNNDIKSIIYSALTKKLDALKSNRETMGLLFTFHTNGELTDISFTLRENTLISLQDIEKIDVQLRSKIKATFTGKQYVNYKAINYSRMPRITF